MGTLQAPLAVFLPGYLSPWLLYYVTRPSLRNLRPFHKYLGVGWPRPMGHVSRFRGWFFKKAAADAKSLAQNKAVNLPAISRVPPMAMTTRNVPPQQQPGSKDKTLGAQVQEIARITIK